MDIEFGDDDYVEDVSSILPVHARCFYSNKEGIFDDVFELCGATAKVSVMMIRRRHYKVGPNFDAVVGIDLTQPQHVQ
eukprot:2747687-Prorocentrum_lima.AAC.1